MIAFPGGSLYAGLAVGRYEVTRGEFAAFARHSGRDMRGCFEVRGASLTWNPRLRWDRNPFGTDARLPAVCISYEDARAYVRWLTKRTGKAFRLPRGEEWAFAARGGNMSRFAWGNRPRQRLANCADCYDGVSTLAEVGAFDPNRLGFHDLHGNVWEWTTDCWHDAHGKKECGNRIMRGGGWDTPLRYLGIDEKLSLPATYRIANVGFRVALEDAY